MSYIVKKNPAFHVCWDAPDWDGTMQAGCPGCDEAAAHPCEYCGYGQMFTTHNPEPHYDGNDPQVPAEDDPKISEWADAPHLIVIEEEA